MKQLVTQAIILARTDYGEADRIITVLTPGYGKLSLLAKGVRRVKSKLAGGIELFSVSTITFVQGRGSVGTLVSTRLLRHYGRIVEDLDRTMLGYDLIKQLNKTTEDQAEEAYFSLLQQVFEALNEPSVPLAVIRFWFACQLLRLEGHTPNLQTDSTGSSLSAEQGYDFDLAHMSFSAHPDDGRYKASHIKFLRLAFAEYSPQLLAKVQGSEKLVHDCAPLVQLMQQA